MESERQDEEQRIRESENAERAKKEVDISMLVITMSVNESAPTMTTGQISIIIIDIDFH